MVPIDNFMKVHGINTSMQIGKDKPINVHGESQTVYQIKNKFE